MKLQKEVGMVGQQNTIIEEQQADQGVHFAHLPDSVIITISPPV